ncbi:hypothetical protein EYC80_000590 [Monilinia laxa]|uniref:thioredoxin-dependent peroxiredoxin n=1 Tax=Monilinia laxa TaxID=61186 RepID=A0A5N6KB87_MONLA|nr:hypothetical protein EYC80_000590 [Monilinia laxa]
MSSAASIYEFEPLNKKGEPTPLSDYKGKVLLIVNTASKCGFTPQFEGLEKLYKDVKEKHGDDFVILGFPYQLWSFLPHHEKGRCKWR